MFLLRVKIQVDRFFVTHIPAPYLQTLGFVNIHRLIHYIICLTRVDFHLSESLNYKEIDSHLWKRCIILAALEKRAIVCLWYEQLQWSSLDGSVADLVPDARKGGENRRTSRERMRMKYREAQEQKG